MDTILKISLKIKFEEFCLDVMTFFLSPLIQFSLFFHLKMELQTTFIQQNIQTLKKETQFRYSVSYFYRNS